MGTITGKGPWHTGAGATTSEVLTFILTTIPYKGEKSS
jgi:hypothetical protein